MAKSYSYFTLELDTTPPSIEIVAPQLIVPGVNAEIYIIANEQLDVWQEIYVVDSAGTRHDLTFQHQGDRLYGLYDFWNCTLGIAKIYARVRDGVHNLSNIASHPIEVASETPISRLTGRYQIVTIDGDIELDGRLVLTYNNETGLIGRMSTDTGDTIEINLRGQLILKQGGGS